MHLFIKSALGVSFIIFAILLLSFLLIPFDTLKTWKGPSLIFLASALVLAFILKLSSLLAYHIFSFNNFAYYIQLFLSFVFFIGTSFFVFHKGNSILRNNFLIFFTLVIILPSFIKIIGGAKGYKSPDYNRQYGLVALPLSNKVLPIHWKDGIYEFYIYNADNKKEFKIDGYLSSPMNFSGKAFALSSKILKNPKDTKLQMSFKKFINYKFNLYGDKRLSRRTLGPLSFPTANVYLPKVYPKLSEEFKVRLYQNLYAIF